jgi:hypothetical protein
MAYEFRPAAAENVDKQVFIALAGTTGAGKTESALRIARGIVGEKGKFCVIDTEHRRALNKKDRYDFDHLDMQPPYSPANFKLAIEAAIKAGYACIVIDNFSHEWFGEGGCSDMQEEALEQLSGGDSRRAERMTALAWKKPKQEHKKLINRILQCSVPIIFCLRAEPKIKFQKDAQGRTQVVDAGWQPIAEKMLGYEMLIYAFLMPDNPGVPDQLKKLEPELESIFPMGKADHRGIRSFACSHGRPAASRKIHSGSICIGKITGICKELNAHGDSIKWSMVKVVDYARETLFNDDKLQDERRSEREPVKGDRRGPGHASRRDESDQGRRLDGDRSLTIFAFRLSCESRAKRGGCNWEIPAALWKPIDLF